MNGCRLGKEIYRSNVEGHIGKGRSRRIFSDQVDRVLKKAAVRNKNKMAWHEKIIYS